MHGERGSGETGDECVALGGGDAKDPSDGCPGHNAHGGSGKRYERRVGVSAKVDHPAHSVGNRSGDERHADKADEVAHHAHGDRLVDADGTRAHGLGDGVRGVCRAVHEYGPNDENHYQSKERVGLYGRDELGEADHVGVTFR